MRLPKNHFLLMLAALGVLCVTFWYLNTGEQTVSEHEFVSSTHIMPTPPNATGRTRIAIYVPGSGGFGSWREYGRLVDMYRSAEKRKARDPVTKLPSITVHCPLQNRTIDVISTIKTAWLETCNAIIVNLDKLPNAPSHQRPAIKALGNKVKWFVFSIEAPDRYQFWNRDYKDIMFQYSISYHSESTVTYPYGRYTPNQPMDFKPRNWASGKTRLVAWMASGCGGFSWPRTTWVQKLQTIIPVDMYGKCGNLTCGKFDSSKPVSQNYHCVQVLGTYKFYLALENAECDEYMTEKFWENSLLTGSVPIVYGGHKEAYTRVAPPNSFIHLSDFESMQKLADYIKYLDANDEEYNKYFAWRYVGKVEQFYPPLDISKFMCNMLPVLDRNEASVPFKKVEETNLYKSCSHTPNTGVLPWSKWKPRE